MTFETSIWLHRGVICKKLKHLETVPSESTCSELAINKKKWFCVSIYRPPNYGNLNTYFNEITISLTKPSLNYEKFILMGNFNTDIYTESSEADKLEELCCLFDLINLFKQETCFTKNHKSLIDLILKNRLHFFQYARNN